MEVTDTVLGFQTSPVVLLVVAAWNWRLTFTSIMVHETSVPSSQGMQSVHVRKTSCLMFWGEVMGNVRNK